jgi:hypothetical protein
LASAKIASDLAANLEGGGFGGANVERRILVLVLLAPAPTGKRPRLVFIEGYGNRNSVLARLAQDVLDRGLALLLHASMPPLLHKLNSVAQAIPRRRRTPKAIT